MTTLTQQQWIAGLGNLTFAFSRWDEAPVRMTLPDGTVTTVVERTPDLTQAGLLAEARMRSLFGEQPYRGPAVVLIEAIDLAIIGSLGGSVLAALGLTATQAKSGVSAIKELLSAAGVSAPSSAAGIVGAIVEASLHMQISEKIVVKLIKDIATQLEKDILETASIEDQVDHAVDVVLADEFPSNPLAEAAGVAAKFGIKLLFAHAAAAAAPAVPTVKA